MMHERIKLPQPWCHLEVFDLLEPVRRDDKEAVYRQMLYLADPNAPGGRILLKTGPELALPLRPVSGPQSVESESEVIE